uniref:Uncharacterized protein n=1 Tax=Chlamydomonas leiostraca TaxID=1034604 RepID=A0A7S0R5J3_9CHLO|mmetsp:Transcript_14189/g.35030  ORF Transcript_14189/g.35030 Transcript_14189/m.35030 type:complete len:127 (+) Transcript_14189:60-440(+)
MVVPEKLMTQLVQARNALYKVGIKEPWFWSGSWTNPDFLHFLPSGHEYRKVAPGSQLVKAKVPHDHPSLVYDIKYHVRDYRRNNIWKARTVDAKPFDFSKMFADAPLTPKELKEVPIPAMMPTRGY